MGTVAPLVLRRGSVRDVRRRRVGGQEEAQPALAQVRRLLREHQIQPGLRRRFPPGPRRGAGHPARPPEDGQAQGGVGQQGPAVQLGLGFELQHQGAPEVVRRLGRRLEAQGLGATVAALPGKRCLPLGQLLIPAQDVPPHAALHRLAPARGALDR